MRRRLACLTICTRTMLILFMKILSERKSSSLLERWMTRLTTNALIPAHCGVETARGQAGLPTLNTQLTCQAGACSKKGDPDSSTNGHLLCWQRLPSKFDRLFENLCRATVLVRARRQGAAAFFRVRGEGRARGR